MKYKFVKNQPTSSHNSAKDQSFGGSFDEAILETMGKLGKVGLSQAIKSKMVKRASAKMVDKMLDNIANKIN